MKNLGQLGEDLAAQYYQKSGFKILDRNYIFPHGKRIGELDLVCVKGGELVFVEVKLRSNDSFGGPLAAVDFSKQRKLVKMAKLYLQLHPDLSELNYRIDVAAISIDNKREPVTILQNAIEDFD
jgi:putative endonuclease